MCQQHRTRQGQCYSKNIQENGVLHIEIFNYNNILHLYLWLYAYYWQPIQNLSQASAG